MERKRTLKQTLPLIAMLGGALFVLGRSLTLDVTFIFDSPGYIDFDFSKGVLDNFRTFAYPLFLKGVAWVSPDYQLLPAGQTLLHVLAVLMFWYGLRHTGFSDWVAAITAIPLYFSRTVAEYARFVLSDSPALSLSLLTLGVALVAVTRARRAVWWLVMAVILFLTYMTRPAYIFLIGLVPVLGILIACLQGFSSADLRKVAVKLALSCFIPFLLFCALRWFVVGHFGVVSAGGVNAIGIAAEMNDPAMCKALPHHLRPMALRMHQERDVFFPRRCIMRQRIDMTVPPDWFNYNVHYISYPLTIGLCGTNTVSVVNARLSEFCSAVFLQSLAAYGLWIAFSFARDAFGILLWLRWELLCLFVLAGGACALSYVNRTRLGEGSSRWLSSRRLVLRELGIILLVGFGFYGASSLLVATVKLPDSRYTDACYLFLASLAAGGFVAIARSLWSSLALREMGIVLLIGLGFYGTSLLLVAMVELPHSRYTDACHLFLPSLLGYGFVVVTRSLWNSVVVLVGGDFRMNTTHKDTMPSNVRESRRHLGRRHKIVWCSAFLTLAALGGWLGWRALGGCHDRMNAFFDAVQRGDTSKVTRMLERDHGLARQSCTFGVTGLHVAAIDGQETIAKLLLQHGADVRAADRDGLTPLHWAAVAGEVTTMSCLLTNGADANAASKGGIRPIHLARTVAVVSELIRQGANLDAADSRGFGPLHWALEPDVATALVKGGANPNKAWRDTAGLLAMSPLQHAVKQFNGPLGKCLLELGADPNARDAQGRTALFVSMEASQTLLDDLLAHGANPSIAVEVGSMSKWQLRIAGVAAFLSPEDDMTALHWATLLNDPGIIKELAASVAVVNARSRLGMTPLHWAAGANKLQAVAALLSCGADPSVRDNAGQTALDLAGGKTHAKIAKMLRKAKARANTPMEGGR